ncbi:hypothetical protein, conserved [Plasmodium vivax]|uniref:Uncharacterized protein n=3 Tax=Plasmodium vivax TaxID=5855 RepID=A5KAF1_PLAVS|nr:hypothetical protein, conserved [Plasmodium vivax]EDL43787.1 hypothetical protein, conserved [Plasmodium vivax]KMZ89533.1 hypothetical protein PVBG_03254 [Plasmodium vivax Brazil I]KNA02508.1 hypothetical protein PVNG_03801 [Plasmodium vivax North Korean]|eukprot:XP_001613514.1 hypothetical protein [Plasmodium vivax Sal-1]
MDNAKNENTDGCSNPLSPRTNDLKLEERDDKSREHESTDDNHEGLVNQNGIYRTAVYNNKRIKIYQYKTFPKNYLQSVYELLGSELSEPYNIFLLKTILKNYSEIALMCLCDEECMGTVISKITTKCKNDEPTTFGYICKRKKQKCINLACSIVFTSSTHECASIHEKFNLFHFFPFHCP